jgi:hypothetical protein
LPHSDDISRVQRVHSVRKIRLERALLTAQRATQAAEAELIVATEQKLAQLQSLITARDELRQNPTCAQTLLWRGLCAERMVEAEGYVVTSNERLDQTKIDLTDCTCAARNHELRTDQIDAYGRALRRQEARHVEMLGEDELLPTRNGAQP